MGSSKQLITWAFKTVALINKMMRGLEPLFALDGGKLCYKKNHQSSTDIVLKVNPCNLSQIRLLSKKMDQKLIQVSSW